MSQQLTITKELANICVAATELCSIQQIIHSQIKAEDFSIQFSKIIGSISQCYGVVTDNLMPLATLNSESAFESGFDECFTSYKSSYLQLTSKPRNYSDQAHEEYLMLQDFKQCKTSFPLLKSSFERLYTYVDKWVTNDAWLAMSIENLLKILPRLLTEIYELKQKSPEDAYVNYAASMAAFTPYLALIYEQQKILDAAWVSYTENALLSA